MLILMEDQIQDPNRDTLQTDKISSFFGGTNWHIWLLQLMPEINKKTYWYPDTVDIISRFDNYRKIIDTSVEEATPQKILLKEMYG